MERNERDRKLYAASYQRRRDVWTLINGGPGSAIWKTTDGGVTWKQREKGLPKEDLGGIALAIAPSKPDTVYALVEAANKEGGFFRSTDQAGSWEKRSPYVATAPMYSHECSSIPGSKRASTRWIPGCR